ncbi:hypothetical protein IAD21_04022 [Abditibacteriota bacterium]|nr:hypothetical protein IAD21_04022 [Abditibacteriota bacterium]
MWLMKLPLILNKSGKIEKIGIVNLPQNPVP